MKVMKEPEKLHEKIDRHFETYLKQNPSLHERWLLEQTVLTGPSRRSVLQVLPLFPGARILDVGTGFGAMAFDVAATIPASITALDVDPEVLGMAAEIQREMQAGGCFQEGSSIVFTSGDVYEIPFSADSFDFVFVRFVYQHLEFPELATQEIARVLAPGGYACLMDVDDQLVVTYPEPSGAFKHLQDAVARFQQLHHGDRLVGRKLASFIDSSDLNVVGTLVYPDSQFMSGESIDRGHEFTLSRFHELREGILRAEIMSEAEFDSDLEIVRRELKASAFHATGIIIAFGQKGRQNDSKQNRA